MDLPAGAGLLQQHTKHVIVIKGFFRTVNSQFKTKIFSAGADHIQGLRMHIIRNKKAVGIFLFTDTFCHRHGFRRCGRFIQQRGGCQFQTGQIDSHLLEIQQRFQTALGDFRLIRRVRGIPARIFQQIA